jgi:hypothetical protein
MTKNKKIGLLLLLGPIALLFLIVFAYAIAQFSLTASMSATAPVDSTGLAPASGSNTAATIINAILGLLGLLSVVGIFLGIPLGIYFLVKKEDAVVLAENRNKPEYQNLTDEQLLYVKKWSWGAFFGVGIWTLGSKLYLWALPFWFNVVLNIIGPLLIFTMSENSQFSLVFVFLMLLNYGVGLLTFILTIYLAIKGRDLAWKKGWPNFEAFKKRQKLMAWIIWGIVIAFIVISALLAIFALMAMLQAEGVM